MSGLTGSISVVAGVAPITWARAGVAAKTEATATASRRRRLVVPDRSDVKIKQIPSVEPRRAHPTHGGDSGETTAPRLNLSELAHPSSHYHHRLFAASRQPALRP